MKRTATQRKTFDKNWSSSNCGVPGCWPCGLATPGLPSLKLKFDAKKPNGNAPIPKLRWNPPSPNPNDWKPLPCGSGSVLWPAGRGGTFVLE